MIILGFRENESNSLSNEGTCLTALEEEKIKNSLL